MERAVGLCASISMVLMDGGSEICIIHWQSAQQTMAAPWQLSIHTYKVELPRAAQRQSGQYGCKSALE